MAAPNLWEIVEKANAAKGYSLEHLAGTAKVAVSTLYRWQSGVVRPRLEEFLRLAKGLEMSFLDECYGIAFLAHPQATEEIAWRIARDEALRYHRRVPPRPPSASREQEPALWRPGLGDLLQAMQRRAGFPAAETARRLGESETRVNRWMNSRSPVPEERLDALLGVLGAQEEERRFLREHAPFLETPCWAGTAGLHAAVEQHIQVNDRHQAGEALLGDLEYLVVENRLWPHALEDPAAREVLGLAYYNHSMWLNALGRFREADSFAQRSRLMALKVRGTGRAQRSRWWPHAVIISASSLARQSRRRAIEELRCYEGTAMDARFREYFQRELAELYSLAGNFGLAKQHIEIAENAASEMDVRIQNVVQRGYAQILLRANRPEAARKRIPDPTAGPPHHQARSLALQIAAFRQLGETDEAARSRQRLDDLLAQHPHLQPLISA